MCVVFVGVMCIGIVMCTSFALSRGKAGLGVGVRIYVIFVRGVLGTLCWGDLGVGVSWMWSSFGIGIVVGGEVWLSI
jgi:hypothetical protein